MQVIVAVSAGITKDSSAPQQMERTVRLSLRRTLSLMGQALVPKGPAPSSREAGFSVRNPSRPVQSGLSALSVYSARYRRGQMTNLLYLEMALSSVNPTIHLLLF